MRIRLEEEPLLRSKRNDQAVLLNLPVHILEQVDMAVREQGVTRSQFLRQAVERNLRHYQKVERAIFARIYQQGMR
jgi:metal-responsive CopG/Arc/MetJ family transcriptional regulator